MEHIKISETLTLSRLIPGLWQIADMEREGGTVDQATAAEAMKQYTNNGFTAFDMADHYGSAELIAGYFNEHFNGSGDISMLTKWVPKLGRGSFQDVRDAVQLALDRLKTDSLDLLQYHAWNYADPVWLDQLFWLQELKEEGLIKNLGVTNFDTAHLRIALASGIQIAMNQICYSLLDQRAAGQMTSLCKEFDVKILAFGTLAGGFLSEKWLNKEEPESLQTWSQMKYKRFIDVAGGWKKFQDLLSILSETAKTKGVSIPNIATRYMLQKEGVASVIIGARLGQSEHIHDNLKVFDFELTPSEESEIEKILDNLEPVPGDCGDEYRKPPFLTASGDLSHHLTEIPKPFNVVEQAGSRKVFSGTIWEDIAGFSRATIKNGHVYISGTTATHGTKAIGGTDPIAQTHFVIDKIEGVLQSLDASLENVVRTKVFIQNLDDWEVIARAHGERFKNIQPANTMVRADLIGEDYLVEIEAEAVINPS